MNPQEQQEAKPGIAISPDLDRRVGDLRASISQVGQEIDEYKAKTAAAMGGGVFLGLLAAGAGYDLAIGRAGVWINLGISHQMLVWLAIGLGAASFMLLIAATLRQRLRDAARESRLADLEEELARLLGRGSPAPGTK